MEDDIKGLERIRAAYDEAETKRQKHRAALDELERSKPDNLHEVFRTRDRLAYWQGRVDALRLALDELEG